MSRELVGKQLPPPSAGLAEQLSAHLGRFQAAPVLFVGSGLSRRYLSVPTWKELLQQFAGNLPKAFEYYVSKADGELPQVASLMAQDFHEVWWGSEVYKDARNSDAALVQTKEACLKVEIARFMRNQAYVIGQDEALDREVESLRTATVDCVITTNWDRFLESVFPDFEPYVGQEALLFSSPQSIAEVYKIHGCCSVPASLVLTSDDYKTFGARNPYLASKLLTLFVEHPVVFMGYALGDRNIAGLLHQIVDCLSSENLSKLADRLIFVQRAKTPAEVKISPAFIQPGGRNIPVTVVHAFDFGEVYAALSAQKRKFPARLLRKMKKHLYDLVLENDASGKMFVLDIEKAEDVSELEVVYGVGVSGRIGSIGYAPVQLEDLLKDVLQENSAYDPKKLVDDVLPRLLKPPRKYVPLCRYLRAAGKLTPEGEVDVGAYDDFFERASLSQDRFRSPKQYAKEKPQVVKLGSVAEVAKGYDLDSAVLYMSLLNESQIDITQLRQFLVANLRLMESPNALTKTYFGALICLYDWLAYR